MSPWACSCIQWVGLLNFQFLLGSAHARSISIRVRMGILPSSPRSSIPISLLRASIQFFPARDDTGFFPAKSPFPAMAICDPLTALRMTALLLTVVAAVVEAGDNNRVFSPCADTTVQKSDGFTLGFALAQEQKFVFNKTLKLTPCDTRLSLSNDNSLIAVFRPKVDEISLLTINTSSSSSSSSLFSPAFNGYMVAFAGRKYAARSPPIFVADDTHIITSFTLVLEFQKGRLQNLFWKRDGCARCSQNSTFVCLNNQDCAIKTNSCKIRGGSVDCSISIQLAFSGTDKHLSALNSWYEVSKLHQYSLFNLYANLKDSLTSQYNKIF